MRGLHGLPVCGEVDVDAKGAWSTIVGSVAALFGRAPDAEGRAAVMVFGPHLAPDGITARTRTEGAVHAALTCAEDGEAIAEAFLHGRSAFPKPLTAKLVRGAATLRARATGCPVLMVVRSRSDRPVRFAWSRPDREAVAATTGGPLVACAR